MSAMKKRNVKRKKRKRVYESVRKIWKKNVKRSVNVEKKKKRRKRKQDEEGDGGSSESSSETDTEDEDDKSGKVQPRNLYQLEFDALLNDDGNQDDADEDNDDDDDDVSDSKLPNIAESPQKCRCNPSKKKKTSAKEKDKETAKKKNDPLSPLTPKEKPNHTCIAKAKCQAGSRHIYDDDVRAGRTRFCDRCKLLAHMNCTKVRQFRLVCLLCFHRMKEEAARIPQKPKEPENILLFFLHYVVLKSRVVNCQSRELENEGVH